MRLLSYGCDKTGVTLRETEQSGIWHKTEAPGTILNDDGKLPGLYPQNICTEKQQRRQKSCGTGDFYAGANGKTPCSKSRNKPKTGTR